MTLVPGVSDGMVNLKSVVLVVTRLPSLHDSVGDLITDDDSIRFLRGTPSEHYGGVTTEVRHSTRNCKKKHLACIHHSVYLYDHNVLPSSSVRTIMSLE